MDFMPSPWLKIPLQDYEGHMNAPHVAQSDALADLFEETLRKCIPDSVAILGIAGGNGLSRIDPAVTTRIVGVDINPAYLEAVCNRFQAKMPLILHCLDLAMEVVPEAPVDLVHAALIFEHAGTETCLDSAVSLVAPDGYLSTVLQLPPSNANPNVAPSQYTAMQTLSEHFRLVEPDNLRQTMKLRGFELQYETRRALRAGKGLWLGIFRRLL
jgi:methyltransferase family protein